MSTQAMEQSNNMNEKCIHTELPQLVRNNARPGRYEHSSYGTKQHHAKCYMEVSTLKYSYLPVLEAGVCVHVVRMCMYM